MDKLPALLDVTGPNCGNCPYALADPSGQYLFCRRFPPAAQDVPMPISALPREQQLALPAAVSKQGVVMTRQSNFPAVQARMVCGEHPDFDIGEEPAEPASH